MYWVYLVTLLLLFIILALLLSEERRLKKEITHGLAKKYWVLRERRRYTRFDDELKIRYDLGNNVPLQKDSKSRNISARGICLIMYEKLKRNTPINIEIEIPRFNKTVRAAGEVAWVKDLLVQDDRGRRLFYTGVSFCRITPENEALITAHINTLKPTR